MRNHEIESWAYDIFDRVQKHQSIEDSRVELKSEWIDATKAARQIAGHANASRGEPILWLIGIDEKQGTVPGVIFTELSSWYEQVKAQFDELAPDPLCLNIPFKSVTVAALYFETDRAPYVVKNPKGGMIQREVPWRANNRTDTATRSQLLSLLSPLQKQPKLEVIAGYLKVENTTNELGLRADISIFLTQPAEQETVIPRHKCWIKFNLMDSGDLKSPPYFRFKGDGSTSVQTTENAVSIRGAGLFEIRYGTSFPQKGESNIIFDRDARIELSLYSVHIERAIKLNITLSPDKKKGEWSKGAYQFYD